MPPNPRPLSRPTIALHWIVGFGMIGLIGMGFYMAQTSAYGLYSLHKSLGLLLFLVILVRAAWRLYEGWPEEAAQSGRGMHLLSRAVHWILLLGTLALPISGIVMNIAGGRGLQLFGLDIVSANLSAETGRALALSPQLYEMMGGLHSVVAFAVVAALGLHIAGALKHHVIDRDATLRRMLSARRAGPAPVPAE